MLSAGLHGPVGHIGIVPPGRVLKVLVLIELTEVMVKTSRKREMRAQTFIEKAPSNHFICLVSINQRTGIFEQCESRGGP
jgi:hypothetical protein